MFNVEDAAKVLELTKRITEKGIGIIYISHFLNEVVQIADRITVIRDGAVVRTYTNENRIRQLPPSRRTWWAARWTCSMTKKNAPLAM